MDVASLRKYCLSLPFAKECFPWNEPQYEMLSTFTVAGKWFCLLNSDEEFVDLKCKPENVEKLQSEFDGIFPAWHMNKQHWIGVKLYSDLTDDEIEDLLKQSYDLVFDSLSKVAKAELAQ